MVTVYRPVPNGWTEAFEVEDLAGCVERVMQRVARLTPEQKARVVCVTHAPYDLYIGRRMRHHTASKWANPFRLIWDTPEERSACLAQYIAYLIQDRGLMGSLEDLHGKVLGCWCRKPGSDVLCHGLVLLALAEMAA
jgi:hypothetical protein